MLFTIPGNNKSDIPFIIFILASDILNFIDNPIKVS